MDQDQTPPASEPAPTGALVPVTPEPRELDAHGFDPADYDWRPVRRKPRPDGFSAEKQRVFIHRLYDTGSVAQACREARISRWTAYALRRAPDGAGFAAAWDAAIAHAMATLLDVVTDRAINGAEELILDRDGQVVERRVRFNDRLAMFLLRAHMPDRFRHAHRDVRAPGEPAPPPPAPLEEMLRLIDPAPPAEPAKLMAPDELATRLQVADMLDGELPHWLRDTDLDPEPAKPSAAEAELTAMIDAMLDQARRENNPHWRPYAERDEEDAAPEERPRRRHRRPRR